MCMCHLFLLSQVLMQVLVANEHIKETVKQSMTFQADIIRLNDAFVGYIERELFEMCKFQVIYEDLSDISQLNDKMRVSSLPHNEPLITRLIHYHK